MGNAIEVHGVGIEFAINRKAKMRTRDLFIHGRRAASSDRFWALKDVSLTIGFGESVALVGSNGSGKSTLLKIIAGVLIPDEGTVEVSGPVAPLIQLGAGFSPQLSARENVYLSGTILGLTREQIDDHFDEIVDFAEIRRFLDTPMKHFSSGMKARLGFSIVAQLERPVYLIDEVLAVGDRNFKKKCYGVMQQRVVGERTLVFVSHSEADIIQFCTRAVYLKDGRIVQDGPVDEVLKHYAEDSERRR